MFKQITAGILLVAISLQILNRAVIYIDYYTNTAAFAKNCINKARPMMHCNGKCQAMKKLKEQEKNEHNLPGVKTNDNSDVLSSKSFFPFLPSEQVTIHSIKLTSPRSIGNIINQSSDFFHPPQS